MPLRARLEGESFSAASLWVRGNCSAARPRIDARSGLVAAMHEALKRFATAPVAVGTAVELLMSHV
jgi:hypothetical protein